MIWLWISRATCYYKNVPVTLYQEALQTERVTASMKQLQGSANESKDVFLSPFTLNIWIFVRRAGAQPCIYLLLRFRLTCSSLPLLIFLLGSAVIGFVLIVVMLVFFFCLVPFFFIYQNALCKVQRYSSFIKISLQFWAWMKKWLTVTNHKKETTPGVRLA